MNAKLVLCLSIVAILSPGALAIIAGFNADIHMDIPGTIANDFHIEGKIKSGVAGGGWNSPPILVGHIDGSFPIFNYAITPDLTSPGQNEYIFKADWSGFAYKYCEILHLGLFFDLECHNLVIDLVGWWTFNGQRLGGANGGTIPISGFIVQDLPDQDPQQMRILNDSQLGGSVGIPLEILQLQLIAMPREMALEIFEGSLEKIFPELRLGGMQEQLPWIPIRNARGPINPDNSLQFVPDSFFDIFLEVAVPDPTNERALFPVQPMHIQPAGVLLSRMLVRFVNNAGEPDFRWVWHMHEAHPLGDLGDAPDSTNHFGAAMTAYPPGGPMGVQANYPSVFVGPFPFGPMHMNPQAIHLGAMVSPEMDADLPPDLDGPTNITPPADQPDKDGFDDGIVKLNLKPCQLSDLEYLVTVNAPVVNQMYVNVWFDWNRDGDWDDTLQCATSTVPSPEWVVQNQVVPIPGPGSFPMTTPQFMTWFPAATPVAELWMRITIADQPVFPPMPPFPLGFGGSGPQGGYKLGETEDYFLRIEFPPDQDFGDAPDGIVPAYPTLLASNGARHDIDPAVFLGNLIDPEANGQPDATATGDDLNNLADEDGVKFLTWPLVPGKWAKIEVKASVAGLLYGWIDYGADNSWAETGDQVFNAKPLVAGVQTLPFFVPITAKANSSSFARFRFTRSTVALGYDGYAPNGEVEDYQVKIGENCGIKWVQLPDTTPNGIDISVDQQWTLADDFLCTSVDKITDVHLWGSWLRDQKGAIKKIHLSIHSDDPVGPEGTDPQNEWSKPDKLLWQLDFVPGEFTEKLYAKLPDGEYWWDPFMDIGPIPGGDTEIWQVDIKIDPEKAFLQDGSREKPIVYWLDVHVDASDGRFGWKTRRWPDHFNDDAVMLVPIGPAVVWRELRYPPQHPYYQSNQNSIDMAFAITAREFCCGSADLNCDGLVDLQDFAIFASQWLMVAP